MRSFTAISTFLSLLTLSTAQTPSGFTPAVSKSLNIKFGTTTVQSPGQLLPRNITASHPNVTSSVSGSTNILIMIDLDIPSNTTASKRDTLLHWFTPGVTASVAGNISTLNVVGSAGAPYLQPTPPAGDIAHRYVVFLFSQPTDFAIPAAYNPPAMSARVGFNLSQFVAQNGLAAPLAANYFEVQTANSTSTATSSATGSASGSSSTSKASTATTATGTASKTSTAVATATKNAASSLERGSFFAVAMVGLWMVGQI